MLPFRLPLIHGVTILDSWILLNLSSPIHLFLSSSFLSLPPTRHACDSSAIKDEKIDRVEVCHSLCSCYSHNSHLYSFTPIHKSSGNTREEMEIWEEDGSNGEFRGPFFLCYGLFFFFYLSCFNFISLMACICPFILLYFPNNFL